jgi:hypothetical protein
MESNVQNVQLFEWERKLGHSYSSTYLLPTDPKHFTDLEGRPSVPRNEVPLTEGSMWTGEWEVRVRVSPLLRVLFFYFLPFHVAFLRRFLSVFFLFPHVLSFFFFFFDCFIEAGSKSLHGRGRVGVRVERDGLDVETARPGVCAKEEVEQTLQVLCCCG